MKPDRRYDRLAGTLLGTALGDALGLPAEGMSARAIARRFGTVNRFRLLGQVGFVSDDTEQTALVAGAIVVAPTDLDRSLAYFRRSLLAWFARLPWGVGRATIRACIRIALGLKPTGVRSAGNGAAMRASVIGVFFADRADLRRDWTRAFAEVTHRDPRAVAGAVFVAEVAALAASDSANTDRLDLLTRAIIVVDNSELAEAIHQALNLARSCAATNHASSVCGTTGFVVDSVAFAAFLWARWGDDPFLAWAEAISAGGDTDTIAAIVGGWIGAAVGESALPTELIAQIHDGPFGPTHLRQLARALVEVQDGVGRRPPRFSALGAFARNMALLPVIFGHGFRRLLPF